MEEETALIVERVVHCYGWVGREGGCRCCCMKICALIAVKKRLIAGSSHATELIFTERRHYRPFILRLFALLRVSSMDV